MAKSFSILQGINGLDDFPPSWNVCADVKVSCGFRDVWHYRWYGYDGTELQNFSIAFEQQRTPLQACITWMTWEQPMFCASCGKSCRDNLAVNGRKELAGLGVTRDRQPTSTTYASLCPKKPTWWQTQSTWRKASADQTIRLTSTASRTKTRVGEEGKNCKFSNKKTETSFRCQKAKNSVV